MYYFNSVVGCITLVNIIQGLELFFSELHTTIVCALISLLPTLILPLYCLHVYFNY